MKSPLFPLPRVAVLALAVFGVVSSLHAQSNYYYDRNDSAPGFGLEAGQEYQWGHEGESFWNSSSAGTGSDFKSWDNTAGDHAYFGNGSGRVNSFTVELLSDIQLAGLHSQASTANGNGITFQSDGSTARSIAFSGDQILEINGAGRFVNFGANVNLTSDVTLSSNGNFGIEGAGNEYVGTIKANEGTLWANGASRFGSGTRVHFTTEAEKRGALASSANGVPGNFTLGEVSGNAYIGRTIAAGGWTFTLDQSTNTVWNGVMARNSNEGNFHFTKSNSGTLVLGELIAPGLDGQHYIQGKISVTGGSLYVQSNIAATAGSIEVEGGGNFGGVTNSQKKLILTDSNSAVTPGLYDLDTNQHTIGVLTLSGANGGLEAESGAVFNIAVNGAEATNSSIVLSNDATASLGGTLRVNFINLGGNTLRANTAYTILTAPDLTLAGWEAGDLPSGWVFGNFSILEGNQLQVTFESISSIPESNSLGYLMLGGVCALIFYRRRVAPTHLN